MRKTICDMCGCEPDGVIVASFEDLLVSTTVRDLCITCTKRLLELIDKDRS